MEQTALTTTFHLNAGINETYVAHWFLKEGERVRGLAPLVTLRHPSGVAFTLRAPAASLLSGAILQHILLAEWSSVCSTDVLAIFTRTTLEAGRAIAPLGAPEPGDSAYSAEMDVDLVSTSSSLVRDFLFERFPRFRQYYFLTYPLLPLLKMACFAVFILGGAWLVNHQLTQLPGAPEAPEGGGWSFLMALAALLPIAIGILAALALFALRQFFLRRLYRLPRHTPPGGSKR